MLFLSYNLENKDHFFQLNKSYESFLIYSPIKKLNNIVDIGYQKTTDYLTPFSYD